MPIKISELTNLGAAPASTDEIPIVDDSASATKKVTVGDLFTSPNITGSVNADGLIVDGSAAFNLGAGEDVSIYRSTDFAVLRLGASSTDHWSFQEAGTNSLYLSSTDSGTSVSHLRLDNNGDISFYEDTGTTAKLFWDASAERLGIGTSSPTQPLHVSGVDGIGIDDYIIHNGDGNTKFGFSGADTFKIRTGGTDAFFVTSSQNVGIGTSSPSAPLDIVSSATGGTTIELDNTSTGGRNFTLYSSGSGNSFGAGNFALYDADAAAVRMLVDSSGNVGIGTSSPDGTLHVKDAIAQVYIQSNDGQPAQLIFGDVSDASRGRINYDSSDNIIFENSNLTERMRIDGSGNVGIGTSSPTVGKLQVDDSSGAIVAITRTSGATSGNLGVIRFGNTNIDSNLANITAIQDGATNSAALTFETQPAGGGTTERMRIDASGNVGIGVVPETDWHSNYAALQVNTGGALASYASGTVFGTALSTNQRTTGDTFVGGNKYIASKAAQLYLQDNSGNHIWYNAPSGTADATISWNERMRINSSGDLLVRCTALPTGSTSGFGFTADQFYTSTTATSANTQVRFYNGNGLVGSIVTDGSATAFNTSSDQRLKDNIVDAPSASDDIDAIQVRSFDWKADGSHQKYGMVAQELQSVAPDAVSGDANSDEMMSVDYSKLVPMLVKEIQTLRARVAQLEGEN